MSRHSLQPPLFRTLRRLRLAFWRRRLIHWLVRAIWLTLLVPVVVMAGYFWQGWEIRAQDLIGAMLVVAVFLVSWSLRPIRLKKMVQRLDNRLGLQTRLITALEVSNPPTAAAANTENLVVHRLLQEAVQLTVTMRSQIRLFNQTFWLEMRALIGVAALLSALIILDSVSARVPDATAVALPPAWQEPTAEEVINPEPELLPPPFPPELQVQALNDAQLRAALESLADALRDQASTRAIAESLDRGDLAGAAEEMRRLADRLGDLSEGAQAELGDSLREAAENIGGEAPILTDPLQAGGNALESSDLLGAGQALEDLAEALDSISESPPETAQGDEESEQANGASPSETGQGEDEEAEAGTAPEDGESQQQEPAAGEETGTGEGSGDGEGASPEQPSEDERLAAEGQPLELESEFEMEKRTLQPAELGAETGEKSTQDSPFARQPLNSSGDLGPDPLSYPWEKREIIRSYFSP